MNRDVLWNHKWKFVILLSAILFALTITFSYDPYNSGKAVLSTLARAQAGIFAIVFSVVVLGVQLSTSQYAPRLATSFVTDSAYRRTVGIFGASIGFDVAVLFLFQELPQLFLTFGLVLSVSIALGAFLTLYQFVSLTLEKTTPEGILSHLKDTLDIDSMIADIEATAEDSTSPDPFLALVSVINSFIEKKDRSSASLGLDILGDRVSALLGSSAADDLSEGSPIDQSLETVCVDQLPNTVEEAVDHDLTQVGLKGSKTTRKVGEAAIENNSSRGFNHTITGHLDLIDTLGFQSNEERIRSEVMETSEQLLQTAAEHGLWESTAIGTRRFGWISAASIMMRDRNDGWNHRYSSILILCFPKILNTAVDSYATFQQHSIQDWFRLQHKDSHSVARLINSCYGSMAEVTSAIIRHEIQTGQSVADWGSIAYGWSDSLQSLDQSNLDSMTQLWFGTLLYLEYLDAMSPDKVMRGFEPHGRHRISKENGEKTVEKIKNGDFDPGTILQFRPGGVDPIELPLTGNKVPIVPDADVSFQEWVSRQPFLFGRRSGMAG